MAAKGTSALGEPTWADDTPFEFSKLSAEIRDKVYCLTLVTGSVTVTDLHPEEWQAEQEAGHATRTSYKTRDHTERACSCGWENGKRCTLNVWDPEHLKDGKVSYTLWRSSYVTPPSISMLALNRQTRAEAVPIFYGKNLIHFYSMGAMPPFLKDRSELSLQSMRHVGLYLEIAAAVHNLPKRRQDGWARDFAELPNIGPLNLRKLTLHVNDPHFRYAWKLKLETKLQRWVHEMAKNITDLDMLGVTLDFLPTEGHMTPAEEMKEDSPTERMLWNFLAPKMLKKIGDEPHDAQSLLKRRIRDDEPEYQYDSEAFSSGLE